MTTLHTRAADMLERYGRVNGVMHCEVSMLIAELRAAAALDELVRENERLGLYDDQRPVAWRCRDYVTGCWFISVKPDPAGSIAGESVPLYAAPSPAQPRIIHVAQRKVEELRAKGMTDYDVAAVLRSNDGMYCIVGALGDVRWHGLDQPALYAAAKAQPRQPLSEWIACDDRLPDNNTHCFVVGPRFNDYRRGQYTAEALFIDGKFFSHDEGDDLYTPSHWFPIPTLPAAPERAITGEKP